MLSRPESDEYFEYYGQYIALVPDGDVRDHLRAQLFETVALLEGVAEAKAEQAYGAGKWTLKEVVLHMSDTERVFGYRMLRIARADKTPLPGFEHDEWVPNSCANARTMSSLVLEFATVRAATLALADSLPSDAWVRKGMASGHTISARALAYIAAGHERHHVKIIRERYLA
ncbi:MAG TPA: DinB family protein [Gemmatimonadaceae bacterium]